MLRNVADLVLTSWCLFPIPCAYTSLNKYVYRYRQHPICIGLERKRERHTPSHHTALERWSALFIHAHNSKVASAMCLSFVNTIFCALEYLQHQQYAFFSSYIGFSFMYTTAYRRYVLWWTRSVHIVLCGVQRADRMRLDGDGYLRC